MNGNIDSASKNEYTEDADRDEYERYKDLIGDEVPSTFAQFQQLKYDHPETYTELCELYNYKCIVPEATSKDFKAYRAIVDIGIKGSVRVPPKSIDFTKLTFNDLHATHHGCTLEESKDYIKNAIFSVTRKRWDGYHTNYYSLNAATYIEDESGRIKTTFSSANFDETINKIMEEFR